jgi:MoaA/NifB/PqqE/SkfB family radical SAM enzyme
MKFQTLSIVAGTQACNANCPFCVSKMTSLEYVKKQPEPINHRNFSKTLKLAQLANVSTVIMTGKGEPFLFPRQIIEYLEAMEPYNFPFIEIQTNGERLLRDEIIDGWDTDSYLGELYNSGVTTILLSNVGPDAELNKQIYFPKRKEPLDMQRLVNRIQKAGINVRLTTIGIKGGVDTVEKMEELVQWAQFLGVKQLTWRPVNEPGDEDTHDSDVSKWVKENFVHNLDVTYIRDTVKKNGTLLYKLVHGAAVYDYKGMNLCLTNCLTLDPTEETIRQLIFYPDGSLYTDWAKKGSVLL